MKRIPVVVAVLFALVLTHLFSVANAEILETVFTEDWESGQGDWDIDNGVWQVGTPTAGPGGCSEGSQCAGTVLNGGYPEDTDSRLITPYFDASSIQLPTVAAEEEIRLRYWQWFAYNSGDSGTVQVSAFDAVDGWSAWESVGGSVVSFSGGWSRKDVDLTQYAGQRIRIAFYHIADGIRESSGWYVDDITVVKLIPEFTGDFEGEFQGDVEGGWGDWSASRGVWQIGMPTGGPGGCSEGSQCAGTVLNGGYPEDTDSRLISAPLQLETVTGMEEIRLRYWQWFAYNSGDSGTVQVSAFDAVDGWSAWESVGGSVVSFSGGWSRKDVDLTQYAGQRIRIAFYHIADGIRESSGWYVDDITVVKLIPEFTGDFEGEFQGDVEGGWGDWSASRGVWQIGMPTGGPGGCSEGSQCAGTVLNGGYPEDTDSRLISAPLQLETVTGMEEIRLRYWQWFAYNSGDSGTVQVSAFDAVDGWSAWESVGGSVVSFSGGWSRKDVDLTQYAGQRIRIAFYHIADGIRESSGWYVDDITVVKLIPEFTGDFEGEFQGDVEGGWGDWSASHGVWQIGTPGSGPGCNAGFQCAGTILNGGYPEDTDSCLVSPPIQLPTNPSPLRFWHWFAYNSGDSGTVYVSVFDAVAGWSAWVNISGPFTGVSNGWTRDIVDLTPYGGEKVRYCFLHSADGIRESSGWYIDHIKLPGVFLRQCEGDFDNDGDLDRVDAAKLSRDFDRSDCSLQDFCEADFDKDGDVDRGDAATLSRDFGKLCFEADPFGG